MADPRFFKNRGPFSVSAICKHLAIDAAGDGDARVFDVAALSEAGPQHLTFFEGGRRARDAYMHTKAGWCIAGGKAEARPDGPILLRCESVQHAFASVCALFYPDHGLGIEAQDEAIHPSARLGADVVVAPGAVVSAYVEIGHGTRLGAGCFIGRAATIGANCEIGAGATIAFAHVGDNVRILPGARIGAPGFGFASDASGHTPIPQLGRVIVQDGVEIGANSAVDRGALGDTVIGEGTKIDNLVQIGHNAVIGRHCVLAGNAGVAGSARLGDFVIVGGAASIGDHAVVGNGARIAGMSGVWGELEGGQDYGGVRARPVREWQREMLVLSKLGKDWKRKTDE